MMRKGIDGVSCGGVKFMDGYAKITHNPKPYKHGKELYLYRIIILSAIGPFFINLSQ